MIDNNYSLHNNYNDNTIVLLTRDPFCLYTYWEISESVKQGFINHFGVSFWNNSKLSLKLYNHSYNDSKYIEVYEEIGCWYINFISPNCLYSVEIGRLFEGNYFISLASSKHIYSPRDKASDNHNVHFIDINELRRMRLSKEPSPIDIYINNLNIKGLATSSTLQSRKD